MTAPAETDRQQLARVLRFARTEGLWRRDGNTWRDGGATEVIWDPEFRTLSVSRAAPFSNEHRGADIEVASIREALDVLAALNVLPYFMSPAYRDGDRAGAARTERVLHEAHQRQYADMVHELSDMIVALGAFVDARHAWKAEADPDLAKPGQDCVGTCEACELLDGLFDEHRARIAAELRSWGYER